VLTVEDDARELKEHENVKSYGIENHLGIEDKKCPSPIFLETLKAGTSLLFTCS
jgi:hypothetical protein